MTVSLKPVSQGSGPGRIAVELERLDDLVVPVR